LRQREDLGILRDFPMRTYRRHLWIAGGIAALIALAGCKGNCRKLSEKLCDCALNSIARDSCLQRASQEDGRVAPTAADDALCSKLLPACDCHTISTAEGKRACGLARVPLQGP
jgi:hypothetical protein